MNFYKVATTGLAVAAPFIAYRDFKKASQETNAANKPV